MNSWISSLLAPSQTSNSRSRSAEVHKSTSHLASQSHGDEKDNRLQRGRKEEHFETTKEEGEEQEWARPPYLHVSLRQSCIHDKEAFY